MPEKDKMIKSIMKQQELEQLRKKYNQPVQNAEFISIEDFTSELYDGDYAIVGGKRVSMRIYGEKIVEEEE
jgi:hypothetical protein